MEQQNFKRNPSYKLKIGSILTGKPITENEKLKSLDINGKNIVRTNLIANVVDKYIQEGEKKFGSITLDDGTGQIKIKTFGDDVERFLELQQGDTIMVIGLLRQWNNEIYLTPEIIKKKDPLFLLVRKLEIESEEPKKEISDDTAGLKDKLTNMIKEAEKDSGIDMDRIIMEIKESPELINKEIKRLLEDGIIYEPRPGRIRWLG